MHDPIPNDENTAVIAIQNALSGALTSWLYSSISSRSFLKTFWQNFYLRPHPLQKCLDAFQKTEFSIGGTIESKFISSRDYASILAAMFIQWHRILESENATPAKTKFVPCGKPYDIWLKQGGSKPKYEPVRQLRIYLQKCTSTYIRALVHGSIPTLDDRIGFSDMDLAFIIKTEALQQADSLMSLREQARQHLLLSYTFDPFMHHGPYYLTEIDFLWYPQSGFPLVLFKHSLDLLENPEPLKVSTRGDGNSSLEAINMFHRFFKKRNHPGYEIKDSFELEWILGSVMLLPALYLQQLTGEYSFKRETFEKAKIYFSVAEWEPVELATELRNSLNRRSVPSKFSTYLAGKMRFPGLLQKIAIIHPLNRKRARQAFRRMGQDYPSRVLRLVEAMQASLSSQ